MYGKYDDFPSNEFAVESWKCDQSRPTQLKYAYPDHPVY